MGCGCHKRAKKLEHMTGVDAAIWHILVIAGGLSLALLAWLGTHP